MDTKQAEALQDTLRKLPKWVRNNPHAREQIQAAIETETPGIVFSLIKTNRKRESTWEFCIRQKIAPFGDGQMRELTVSGHPTKDVVTVTTFTKA